MRLEETEWEGDSAFLVTLRDITQRKRVEEESLKAKEDAELANRGPRRGAGGDQQRGRADQGRIRAPGGRPLFLPRLHGLLRHRHGRGAEGLPGGSHSRRRRGGTRQSLVAAQRKEAGPPDAEGRLCATPAL